MGKMKEVWFKYLHGLPMDEDEIDFIKDWEKKTGIKDLVCDYCEDN